MNGERAEEMLEALGEVLTEMGEKADIVICGGMALVLQRLSTRPTRDIDALGIVVEKAGQFGLERPHMSPRLRQAIARVGTVYNRGRLWLNAAAIMLHEDTELPAGLVDRAAVRHYGDMLTIRMCSRADLVKLKMWASVQRSGPDLDDLIEMKTTEEEAACGFAWCSEQGAERKALMSILLEMGHEQLAERISA